MIYVVFVCLLLCGDACCCVLLVDCVVVVA